MAHYSIETFLNRADEGVKQDDLKPDEGVKQDKESSNGRKLNEKAELGKNKIPLNPPSQKGKDKSGRGHCKGNS